jgi:hypothetical protein
MSRTEPNPKYWAPAESIPPNLLKYVQKWRDNGTYPPRLTSKEKRIVDMQGENDDDDNVYGVGWTLGGRPYLTKTSFVNGKIYEYNGKTRRFERTVGCFGREVLE